MRAVVVQRMTVVGMCIIVIVANVPLAYIGGAG